jgi:hypothetical protein
MCARPAPQRTSPVPLDDYRAGCYMEVWVSGESVSGILFGSRESFNIRIGRSVGDTAGSYRFVQ